jgi:hypothetical protein
MKKGHSSSVPLKVQTEIDALAALPEDQIKTDDIPEVYDCAMPQPVIAKLENGDCR